MRATCGERNDVIEIPIIQISKKSANTAHPVIAYPNLGCGDVGNQDSGRSRSIDSPHLPSGMGMLRPPVSIPLTIGISISRCPGSRGTPVSLGMRKLPPLGLNTRASLAIEQKPPFAGLTKVVYGLILSAVLANLGLYLSLLCLGFRRLSGMYLSALRARPLAISSKIPSQDACISCRFRLC